MSTNQTTPISAVLVANRGEIARRIFRTARNMGMRCIAVYVAADTDAPFVRDADIAVRVDSYMDPPAIIAAANATGAQAIHPGYGFLSENADFARAVADAGLVWVGPSPNVIAAMGDKLEAKKLAIEAGVPTLPSSDDPTADTDIGYPLLVKAAAGGGGKGMRVVQAAADLTESVAAAQREALNGFGDDRVFLERYVPRARHIEIQVLGDTHGNVVHLGERECSIQRRHQKILEESPSPAVDAELRSKMGAAAVGLAASMNYRSAGTVEFLLDDATGEFFFLEVNTRLQVEHPVTEEVTGIDLVREQLRIAAGEPLGYEQVDISFTGHAIEARLYAEDPDNNFLPAIGTLHAYRHPVEPAVRWDTGVEQGSVVGVNFDPMLAKVIAHAPTRSEAAGRLARALERLHLGGVTTNRDFLTATLRNQAFLDGDTTTDFIERVEPVSTTAHDVWPYAVAAAMWIRGQNRANATVQQSVPSNWRNARLPAETISFTNPAEPEPIEISYFANRDGSFELGDGRTARVLRWTPDGIDIDIDGTRMEMWVTRATEPWGNDHIYVQADTTTVALQILPRFVVPQADAPTGGLVAPMPGSVLEVRVQAGDAVTAGQTLVLLEAMKMEHHMNAPHDGVVAEVRVAVGDQVEKDTVLVQMEEAEAVGE